MKLFKLGKYILWVVKFKYKNKLSTIINRKIEKKPWSKHDKGKKK